jgi:hypothetical protein
MASSTKMTVFWDAAPCSPVETCRRFRDDRPDDEVVSTSEISVNFYQTTRCKIPENLTILGFSLYKDKVPGRSLRIRQLSFEVH